VTFRDVPGWTDAYRVFDLVLDTMPRCVAVVELGALLGRGTIYLADRIARSGRSGIVVAIDVWPDSLRDQPFLDDLVEANPSLRRRIAADLDRSTQEIFARNVAACIPKDSPVSIFPVKLDAIRAAWLFGPQSFDLAWLDDCHEHPHVRDEILAWLPLVKHSGWIGGHDLDHPPVQASIREALGPFLPMAYDPTTDDHPELVHAPWNRRSWLIPRAAIRVEESIPDSNRGGTPDPETPTQETPTS